MPRLPDRALRLVPQRLEPVRSWNRASPGDQGESPADRLRARIILPNGDELSAIFSFR